MFATCPHSKLIANRSIIINGFTGTNNLFDFFPINQSFPLFFVWWVQESLAWLENAISGIPKVPLYIRLQAQVSKISFNTLYAPLPPCLGEGRGEKYSQPVPPYFNELLGILQVGGVFWNFILIGGQCFKINLVLYIHKKHQSSRSLGILKAGEKGHHGKSEPVPSNHVSRISNNLSPIVGNIWTGLPTEGTVQSLN